MSTVWGSRVKNRANLNSKDNLTEVIGDFLLCFFKQYVILAKSLNLMATHPNPAKGPWKIDPTIDVNRINLEDLKLIFSQAEKRLDDTVKTGESIASKTMTMIGLMTGVLIALCGYIISNWSDDDPLSSKAWLAILASVYILALFIYMLRNVLPNRYFVLGSEPNELMIPPFFAAGVPEDKITVFLYMSEIENYDLRIEKNRVINDRRWKLYRYSVIWFLILPIFMGTGYAIMQWLR